MRNIAEYEDEITAMRVEKIMKEMDTDVVYGKDDPHFPYEMPELTPFPNY